MFNFVFKDIVSITKFLHTKKRKKFKVSSVTFSMITFKTLVNVFLINIKLIISKLNPFIKIGNLVWSK